MHIKSAIFVKGAVGTDDVFEDGHPQIAFIGRSNVGKSSVLNALTGQKSLARVSARPGRTQQINIFLINRVWYFIDLPGYGYAKGSRELKERLQKLIAWYLFRSTYRQKKVVLIIDGFIGWTESDREMRDALEESEKDVLIVANKMDKVKPSQYEDQLSALKAEAGKYRLIPFSAMKKTGVTELADELMR